MDQTKNTDRLNILVIALFVLLIFLSAFTFTLKDIVLRQELQNEKTQYELESLQGEVKKLEKDYKTLQDDYYNLKDIYLGGH
jgi:cell division protein FtsB